MKKVTVTVVLALMMIGTSFSAQRRVFSDGHGNTLNLGIGIGGYSDYFGYVGHTSPVLHANYEFGVARNFTLAPFVTVYSYRENYYNDYYRETVIPIGVKGTVYLDDLLRAGNSWDFYVAGSLGVSLFNRTWDDKYGRDTYIEDPSPLYLDLHLGVEYKLSRNLGLYLDLSNGVSTVGLAIH